MSEIIQEPSRLDVKKENKELRDKVAELERVVKSLIVAMKEVEDEIGAVMPEGTYYGEKF